MVCGARLEEESYSVILSNFKVDSGNKAGSCVSWEDEEEGMGVEEVGFLRKI